MPQPSFVHLNVHSDFSMIDGLAKVPAIIEKVAEQQMVAVALTDFTNLCGLIKFYSKSLDKGIKPIIGADFILQHTAESKERSEITLLAMNNIGYNNLTLLISKAYLRGYVQDRPMLDKEWLIQHCEGLIILSGAVQGELGQLLLKQKDELIQDCIEFYQHYFPERFYIEVVRTGREQETFYTQQAIKIAQQYQLPLVATNKVRFLYSEDFDAHEVRVAIYNGDSLDDPNRPKLYSAQQYLRSEEEMCQLFTDLPSALQNSVEIAKRCNVTIRLGEYFLPQFPTGTMTTDAFLVERAQEGLAQRLIKLFPETTQRQQQRVHYEARLQLELKVINQMGFPGYFLIVMEFIQWAKDNNIPVGPGRGSGAGSLVAYSLGITELDPLAFDLLFERFLNPERVSMPDFDIDFCMEKRDDVIDHVAEMYGRDAVSQIITFGTMAAKAVIRDVGRVLGHPYSFVDRIAKLIPMDLGMTLDKALEAEPRLKELYQQNEEVQSLIDMARQLEGVTRNAGKHAGGVVISPTQITDFSPLYCDPHGHNPVTQFDKNDVEYAGLVKFDFLGLRTLTIIHWALEMINPKREKRNEAAIDIDTIPLDDTESFKLLRRAETTAVFQLESRGMKDLIKRLQPDCFEDMIALVALFRPGPLQSGMVDNFIDRKHGREEISYPDKVYQHDSLKPILAPTYGVILYQEQVMQIAQTLAGYTLGGADLLRRAMGKKKPEEMAKQRAFFESGAEQNGIDGELAIKIFDLVEKFAGYGFNKSHSAAYALVSYQTLWLKTHYPAEFMAAVMTADMDNTDKIVSLVDECLRMGLKILPPDINSGQYHFHVNDKNEIVYGIGAIKGVGEAPIDAIVEERNRNGIFKDLFEFCARCDLKKLNKRVLEKLVLSGALDRLGPHRGALMLSLPEAIQGAGQFAKDQELGQHDMFGVLTQEKSQIEHIYASVPTLPEQVILEGERETLGLYLTRHPITQYLKEIAYYSGGGRLKDLSPTERNKVTTVVGLVISSKVITTKKGNQIGICTLDDRSGRLDVMLFSEVLEKYRDLMLKDTILIISGQISHDDFNGGLKMIAKELVTISQARERYAKALSVSLNLQQNQTTVINKLEQLLVEYKNGTIPIHLYYQGNEASAKLTFGTEWRVTPHDSLLIELRQLLGEKQVELEFD